MITSQNIFAKCDGNIELWVDYMTEEYSDMVRTYNNALDHRNEAVEGYNDESMSDYSICRRFDDAIYQLEEEFPETSKEFNGSYKNALLCTRNTTVIKVLMKTFKKSGKLKNKAKRLLNKTKSDYEEICE